MKKLLAIAISAMLFSLVAVGCSEEKSPEEESVSKNSVEQEQEEEKKENDQVPEEESKLDQEIGEEDRTEDSVKVYLPNDDATEFLEVDVDVDNGRPIEEVVIDELRVDRATDSDYTKAIRDDIDVNSVRVEGDMAIVDFSSSNLHGGSAEESSIINSVVKSLVALDGIESVQFLVDGEIVDTLMGHYEIGQPYTLSDLDFIVN